MALGLRCPRHVGSRPGIEPTSSMWGFPGNSDSRESTCSVGDLGSIPGLGRAPGGGRGNPLQYSWASLVAQMVKNPPAMQETWVQSLGWEHSFPGEGNGYPLQYSCLENSMDRGAWWATVHGVSMSQTQLSDFTFTFHFHALEKEMATHSSTLAWRIPWTEEPGGLQSMGSQRVRHD